MVDEHISYNLSIDGNIFSCPTHITIGNHNGKLAFGGVVKWGERKLSDVMTESNTKLPEEAQSLVNSMLPDCYPSELAVLYQHSTLVVGLHDENTYFKLAKTSNNTAVLFAFHHMNNNEILTGKNLATQIKLILKEVADFFGIDQFIMYAQAGEQSLLPKMLEKTIQMKQLPNSLQASKILTYAELNFDKDSIFCKGIRTLFGIESTEFYVGISKGSIACMIMLPQIQTRFIESQDLCIFLEFGRELAFLLRGSFEFPYLSGMTFRVNCGIKSTVFRIEALAQVEKAIQLFGPFAIGDTCLMIEVGSSLAFGLYSSLYIGAIQLFGAVMLKESGGIVYPTLLSAATSDLSIPSLVDNLLGEHIPGIEALDFISIQGLPFQEMNAFSMDYVKEKNVTAIVSKFNSEIKSEFLKLDENQVQIRPYGQGADLADLKRMRHYYINQNGKIQLSAQFYYASEHTTLGNYIVERGFFICGVIEIFDKRFEALFSFRESEGILAYAKIPALNLGFLSVGASKFQMDNNTSLPISKDSLLAQFVNPEQEGMVFFLSAGKKEISFYFDGHVTILGLFRVDTRIIYMNRKIALDFYTNIGGLLQVSLHLLVDYASFSTGNFEFSFMLDTSGLTEKLTAVTQKIDAAIEKLKNKIEDAKKQIDRAQLQVNELYGQIAEFDRRIEECSQAIRNASWWKKVFVAIAKGLEIGAYEVAKAGIYIAIGLANAALEVAKGILNLSGVIGEAVLNAVNQVIKGAMSLFYINYIKLEAKADLKSQYFNAEIDIVVLGKKYNFKKQIGKNQLEKDPTGALSESINEEISSDMEHIEEGTFRSSWRKHEHKQYTLEQNSQKLSDGNRHLEASINLMQFMQARYVEHLNMSLEECDEMNVSLIKAFDQVENILRTGIQTGHVAALGNAMGGLKRSVASQEAKGITREGELSEIKALIAEYDMARGFYDEVLESVKSVQKYRKEFEGHHNKIYQKIKEESMSIDPDKEQMAKVILELEEKVYEIFPVTRGGKDIINISREVAIQKCFIEAEEKLGLEPDRKVLVMRSRSRKGDYHNRISEIE